MADKRKIVIEVDDSQFKKYTQEEKKATNEANEREKRKTASLKAELDKRYLDLKATYAKELQAQKTGDELKIKAAVKERIAKTRELNLYEIEVKKTNRLLVEDTKQAHRLEILSYKNKIKEMSSAPRTNLRGTIGSENYVRQLQSVRSGMLPTSPEFAQTTALINRYKDTLKQSGIEVKSLAQNIRGELTSALSSSAGAFIGLAGAIKLFNMSLESARFDTLKANFQGTTEDIELFRKATSGTVDDASLIKLSNQATDLGVGLEQQAILFSLAEDAADKYGTSVEEGFQKVVFATEGNTKGLKMLGIQKAEYEETVKKLALAHGKEIEQLDAETQKEIRLQAILQLSGKTIDDVKNKVQDSADKHEQFIVVVKNLSLVYGGDLFNAVTGVGTAYRVVTEAVSKLSTVTEIQKNIILSSVSAWQNLTSQIPIVGDAISWLADRYRDLAGAQSQSADMVDAPDAGEDFVKAFDPNQPVEKTRKGSDANVKKSGFGSKSSGFTETTQKVLTFLEAYREKVKKLQEEIASLQVQQTESNLADYEKVALYDELIARQKELNELMRVGGNFGLNAMLEGSKSARGQRDGVGQAIQRLINPRAGNDPRQDMSSEEFNIDFYNEMKDQMTSAFSQSVEFSKDILGYFGLADSEVASILDKLSSFFNTAMKGVGLIDTISGFFGGIGSIGGTGMGGSINPMAGGMPRSNSGVLVANISLKSDLEKDKLVRAVVRVTPEVNYVLDNKNVSRT